MGVVLAPIKEGKLDDWKKWVAELEGPRANEFKDFNRRYGLTRHDAWLAETPDGPLVVAMHEGPGSEELMAKVGESSNEFDKWFVERLKELHGMDPASPPPGPTPKKYLASSN